MEEILKNAQKYCTRVLMGSRCKSLPFHNVEHTMEVFSNVKKIGSYGYLNNDELKPVLLAALFHDTGNATVFKGHENFSVIKATDFLNGQNYPVEKLKMVTDCIKATRMPQEPKNYLEEIICDADLFHLGTKFFTAKNKLIRQEWEKFLEVRYTDEAWYALNITFLEQHRYHTKYGKDLLEPIKQKNLNQLKQKYTQVYLKRSTNPF
ncbi:HD domain-containing protein [Zobellia barbeyronii]|uniref:HD domain-containing protein n=1 Tax=Zobellia barbeyronii TaxID=2748009 RepID=A0ABS5WEB7_9FLAO|nr:HD domain-containing protein [Zobellia barbeyronii]MBT2161276.1 HD domain-containing protein [Zobellia barbeyronii]